jgi:Uncharacterized protein conserved in bacteria (DUF2312).
MARRVKASDAARISNGYDGEKVRAYVSKIEGYFADMESEKGAYMRRCKSIRESIDVVYEEAKALGIPKKVLKAHVDLRKLEGKKEAIVAKLQDDDAETFEVIADALGDFAMLPLGQAALRRVNDTAEADAEALASLS